MPTGYRRGKIGGRAGFRIPSVARTLAGIVFAGMAGSALAAIPAYRGAGNLDAVARASCLETEPGAICDCVADETTAWRFEDARSHNRLRRAHAAGNPVAVIEVARAIRELVLRCGAP